MTQTSAHERIEAAVSRLDELAEHDLPDQLAAFTEAQALLAAVLDTEDGPATAS